MSFSSFKHSLNLKTRTLYEKYDMNFFQNNRDSIVERLNGNYCGSCTEPLVSHVLSDRLSRNPLAWSKESLGKMAMLRVFEENGGKVSANHIRISRSKLERTRDYYALKNGFEIYNKYAEEQIKSFFGVITIGVFLKKNIFHLVFLPVRLRALPFFLTLILISPLKISFKKSRNYLMKK